jgi:hypothetical protein
MTAYLSPVLQEAQFNGDATFLVGGLIWFYAAGTSTPIIAYQDEAGTVPWPNPIHLNSRGETGGTIWLGSYADTGGYKIVLEGAPFYGQTHGIVINNFDNITGVNDPNLSTTSSDWISYAGSPSYLSSSSFSVSGDQTSIFQQHRRVKTINNAGVMTGSVIYSSYVSGVTNVYLSNDTGNVLDSGLYQVYYGFIQTTPSSIPNCVFAGTSATESANDIYLSYDGSTLKYSIDSGSPQPIPTGGSVGPTFFTAATSTEGQCGAAFTGVNNAYVYNNATAWGLGSPTNTAVRFDRGTSTYSYGGFNLPTPASSGYITLPNGLVIQWGIANRTGLTGTSNAGTGAGSYPISFPTGLFAIVGSAISISPGPSQQASIQLSGNTLSTFNINLAYDTGTTAVALYWIAIGN